MKIRIFFVCFFFVFLAYPLLAQESGRDGVNHVILAFDEAGNKWRGTDPKVKDTVRELLFQGDSLGLIRSDRDYLSVVGFKADYLDSDNWQDYVYFKSFKPDGLFAFRQGVELLDSFLLSSKRWNDMAKEAAFSTGSGYSLLSVAKPFILSKFSTLKERPLVDHTYIILVTDHRYNGNDFYNELTFFLDNEGYRKASINLEKVLSVCYQMEEEYCIRFLRSYSWKEGKKGGSSRHVELFEVHPNQDYLTLPAVIGFSPSLEAKRMKGNKYGFTLDINHLNKHFDVQEVRVYLKYDDQGKEVLVDRITGLSNYSRDFVLDKKEGIPVIRLEADLKLMDGLYECTRLTPSSVSGLSHEISLIPEGNARFFLGMVELPDWLWRLTCEENQNVAGVIVDVVLALLLLGGGAILIRRLGTYRPSMDEVDIVFYD